MTSDDASTGAAGRLKRDSSHSFAATAVAVPLRPALLRPNGVPVRDDERLLVATNDFLATGGDRIFEPIMPPGGFAIDYDAGIIVRDVVVDALRRRGGTLREDQLIDPANPRWALPGPQPATCR